MSPKTSGVNNPDIAADDARFMDAALRLARKHQGLTGTNPSVACVIVANLSYGRCIVGSGVTEKGGRPHAEPPALAEAGQLARGATAYVTLEPCAHHGKTPPCAQTLIDAGIARVVTACTDPDGRVNGQGHKMLIDAGIEVILMDGGECARRVMQGYLKARTSPMPYVVLKLAMTQEGLIGSSNKGNLKVSGPVSNGITHLERARHHAILIASNTAFLDNPSLNCRLPGLEDRSPVRIVLDAKARLTPEHELVASAHRFPTIVVAPASSPDDWTRMLASHQVQHLVCEMHNGQIALPELFEDLASRGIQSIMVEGGAAISNSLVRENLVDEIVIHVGGDPEYPDDPATAVHAGFNPGSPPAGFELCQMLQFGADTSLRMTRIGN